MSYIKTPMILEIEKILDSKKFFPVIVTGPTGCGKTYPLINLALEKGRKIIPISITHLTDENTLIGSVRIKDGTTFFEEGPVITAMREGSILMLDEFDLALPENIMCLQTIVDGTGYLIKQTGEYVTPSPGFTIFATSNTKGLGDETGAYIGTNILNEAFLERFIITFEVDYMDSILEKQVLMSLQKEYEIELDEVWIDVLLNWANQIRSAIKSSNDFSHNISTRRLVQIIKTFSIYKDEDVSVSKCLSRFDQHHKESFYMMYEVLTGGMKNNKTSELVKKITKEYGDQFRKLEYRE